MKGKTYHSEDDGKIIPPEGMDYPNSSIDAEEEDNDHHGEEESRQGIDRDAPSALIVEVRFHCVLWLLVLLS